MQDKTIHKNTDHLKTKNKPKIPILHNRRYLARAASSNHLQYVELLALNGDVVV